MDDPRGDAVGPVIAEDLVVRGIGKWDRVGGCGSSSSTSWNGPFQATLADKVGDGAILGFGGGGPGEVAG